MANDRDRTAVKKRRYKIMQRTHTTGFTVPADAAAYTTLEGTFTELGYARDRSIKLNFTKGDQETLDDASILTLGFNVSMTAELLQTDPEDYAAYETIEGTEQDFLLVDTVNQNAIFIEQQTPYFEEAVSGGDTEFIPMLIEAENVADKSDFRTRFAIPQS